MIRFRKLPKSKTFQEFQKTREVVTPALTHHQDKIAANISQPRTRNKVRGTLVGVRFQPDQLAQIDAKRMPGMSRADVIRQIIGASR